MTSIKMHVISDPSSGFKYIVTPSPDSNSIHSYKNLLFNNSVTTVLRLCEQINYEDEYLATSNIKVIHMPLNDGDIPDVNTIKQWLSILEKETNGIAVHCRAGLGRAPLFVCIGLIKIGGMNDIEAISLVRKHIKGALNSKQIDFLCNTLKTIQFKQNRKKKDNGCVIA
jgi:protein tyrosine phosphatase type 4A